VKGKLSFQAPPSTRPLFLNLNCRWTADADAAYRCRRLLKLKLNVNVLNLSYFHFLIIQYSSKVPFQEVAVVIVHYEVHADAP
jgi:hypothetical protein